MFYSKVVIPIHFFPFFGFNLTEAIQTAINRVRPSESIWPCRPSILKERFGPLDNASEKPKRIYGKQPLTFNLFPSLLA
jgi:hypothetical protein